MFSHKLHKSINLKSTEISDISVIELKNVSVCFYCNYNILKYTLISFFFKVVDFFPPHFVVNL